MKVGLYGMEYYDRENSDVNLTYNLAFTSVIRISLNNYLIQRDKRPLKAYDKRALGFDFYLPQGLETRNPTYIEVKSSLSLSQVSKIEGKIQSLHNQNNDILERVIIFVGSSISSNEKSLYSSILDVQRTLVEIWDIKDIQKFFGSDFSDYRKIENNPSMVLVNNAIIEQENQPKAANLRNEFVSQLKHEYEQEKVVLVLGAGVSMSAGLPSWNQMISVLQAEMLSHLVSKQRGLPLAKAEQILELANNNFNTSSGVSSPLAQMRFIRSALSSEDYNKMVHNALYSNDITSSRLLEAICRICKPTRNIAGIYSIITHNFDDLLEISLSDANIEYKDICKDEDVNSNDELNIFHVHGFLPRNLDNFSQELDLVFTEEEYHHVYNNPYSWSNLVQINSFRDKTCVFIGSSLSDPNLRRLLDISSRKGENPRHFAFLLRPSIINRSHSMSKTALTLYREILENLNNTYYKTLGLNIIWVDDLNEIPDLLLKLKQ